MTLYQDIAAKIREQIAAGVYPHGSRLPGVRPLSQQFGVSISTLVQAQRQLENSGLIEARPRSGYYVRQRTWPLATTGHPCPFQPGAQTHRGNGTGTGAATGAGGQPPRLRTTRRSGTISC